MVLGARNAWPKCVGSNQHAPQISIDVMLFLAKPRHVLICSAPLPTATENGTESHLCIP